MIVFNDLIGLEYRWGARPSDGSGFTDCFALVMEVRRRFGLHDFYPDFQWVYEAYGHEGVGGRQILRWFWDHGQRINDAREGAIFRTMGANATGLALAAVIDSENALLIGPSQRVIALPFAKVASGRFYWAD
jgi:hypothetical protein